MPGAYAKHMKGERYERLCEAVEECEQVLLSANPLVLHELQRHISRLLLFVTKCSKEIIEELVYAKGLTLFFTIVKQRTHHEWIGDIRAILRFLCILLTHQVDTFDENLGVMPMLTYFLSERHTHSIDIEWNEKELTLMKAFLEAHLALLCAPPSSGISAEDQKIGLQLVLGVLMSYPPHRVVNSCMDALSLEMCTQLFLHLGQCSLFWETRKSRLQLTQLLFFLSSFGLGPMISADLPVSLLIITVQSYILPQSRCPCTHCEFTRRVYRVARERDEFGVKSVSEAKKELLPILLSSNLLDLLCRSLSETLQDCRILQDHPLQTIQDNEIPSENLCKRNLFSEHHDVNVHGDEDFRNQYEKESVTCLHSGSDYLMNDSDPTTTNDQILRFLSLTLLLCSSAYEEMHNGQSILSYGNGVLLEKFLEYFCIMPRNTIMNRETLEWSPGARITTQILSTLALRSPKTERHKICFQFEETFSGLVKDTCQDIVTRCGPTSRHWTPPMGYIVPTLSVLIAVIAQAFEQKIESTTRVWTSLPEDLLESLTQAILSCQEGFLYASSLLDHRAVIKCLLMSMGILTGVDGYLRWPETKRLFFPVAHPSTGSLATSARLLFQRYTEALASKETCVVVHTLASLVISRAEKASCVIPRTQLSHLLLKNHYTCSVPCHSL